MALPGRRGNYVEEPETAEQKIARLEQQLAEREQTSSEQEVAQEETQEVGAGWTKKDRPQGGKFFKFQNIGDSIEGVLKSFFESTFEGKTSNNALLSVDGKDVSFRLTLQLQQYFDTVSPGVTVRIVYRGRLGKMKNFDFYTAE
jgi:hypothetical protein